jgi:membrane protein
VTLIALIPAILVIKMLGNSTAGKIGAFAVLLVALLVVLQFFAKLPVVQRSIRSQLPGALLTVLGWGVFTVMFTFFISRSYRYSNFYGTLAAVFLLVLWMRYMVMILFGGAVLNRVLESKLKSDHIF